MDPEREPTEKLLASDTEDEDYGGPVKSFLEHLEDLRWTLIRVAIAVAVGMLVCLVASNHVVKILRWPMDRADVLLDRYFQNHIPDKGGVVYLEFGTNHWQYSLDDSTFSAITGSTNQVAAFKLSTVPVGTNMVMALTPVPPPPPGEGMTRQNRLFNFAPLEGFKVAFQVALYGGIALASPLIFLFIGQFVLPALKVTEKRLLYQAVLAGAGLFMIGVLFCYFVLLQVVVMAAIQFSNWLGFGADTWRASDYIGTVCKLLLAMGLGFELPVVVLSLVKLGLLDYETMRKFRPYWIVINLVVSAFIMPPDGITMFLMALPMQLLFEISLLIARVWYRRDQAEANAQI